MWVEFVSSKRVFVPSKTSAICSDHFNPEDYGRRFFSLPGLSKPNYPKLRTDDLGVCVYPSIHSPSSPMPSEEATNARNKRVVSRHSHNIIYLNFYWLNARSVRQNILLEIFWVQTEPEGIESRFVWENYIHEVRQTKVVLDSSDSMVCLLKRSIVYR